MGYKLIRFCETTNVWEFNSINDLPTAIKRLGWYTVVTTTTATEGQHRPNTANARRKSTAVTTQANAGPHRPMMAHDGQRQPLKANAGQKRPTQTHSSHNTGQRRPTMATNGQRRPMIDFTTNHIGIYSFHHTRRRRLDRSNNSFRPTWNEWKMC
jgi:hypothetical protein